MPINSTSNLSLTERAAIQAEAQRLNFQGTAEEFVAFYKWGQKDLEECVQKARQVYLDALHAAGGRLFEEEVPVSEVLSLVSGFVAATPGVKAQVAELLAPFAEAAAAAQAAVSQQ